MSTIHHKVYSHMLSHIGDAKKLEEMADEHDDPVTIARVRRSAKAIWRRVFRLLINFSLTERIEFDRREVKNEIEEDSIQ